MKHPLESESWQDVLTSMPARDIGGREPVEPAASAVVKGFLHDVHQRFEERAAAYRENGLEARVEPISSAEIGSESGVVLLVSRPNRIGSSHTLRCQRSQGLDMHLWIDREQLWQERTSFALDREPESPSVMVESSLASFERKFEGER